MHAGIARHGSRHPAKPAGPSPRLPMRSAGLALRDATVVRGLPMRLLWLRRRSAKLALRLAVRLRGLAISGRLDTGRPGYPGPVLAAGLLGT